MEEQQQPVPKKRKIQNLNVTVKVIEQIDLILWTLKDKIEDESFVEWMANEVTTYLVQKEEDVSNKVLSIKGDLEESNIHLLIDTAKRYGSNEFVQRDALSTLASLAFFNGFEFCLAVSRKGGISLVVDAMTKFPQNIQLQRNGCLALGNLALKEPILTTIADGGMEPVIRGMNNFPNDSLFQRFGCATLGNFALNEKNRSIIVSRHCRGRELVLQAMIKFKSMERALDNGIWALGVFSLDSESREDIARQGGIQMVVRAMKKFPESRRLQRNGCFALGSLACDNDENRVSIASKGAVELVVRAMKKFPNDEELQIYCCYVFGQLALKEDVTCIVIAKHGGIGLVVDAMTKYPHIERLQSNGCMALANLALKADNRVTIGKKGAIDLVAKAMIKFPNHDQLQRNGSAALGNASFRNTKNLHAVMAIGGLELVILGMERFPSNESLQENGCSALGDLATSRAKDKVEKCVNLVVGAMNRFPTSNDLVRLGCYALESWSSISHGCRTCVEEKGGVDLARQVWRTILSREEKMRLRSDISTLSNRFIFDDGFLSKHPIV